MVRQKIVSYLFTNQTFSMTELNYSIEQVAIKVNYLHSIC